MLLNAQEVASQIGVDSRETVKNWAKHPKLNHLFSEGTRTKGSPRFTQEDLFVANTVRALKKAGVTDWEEIARRIEEGPLDTNLSLAALEEEMSIIPREMYAKFIEMQNELTLMAQQRDTALEELSKLKTEGDQRLAEQQVLHQQQIDAKDKQINDLYLRIGYIRAKWDPDFKLDFD